ncbi:MAG: hypothetical protein JJU36_09685 [Phycisphaeraceae bacterium]|nr:hypothetical protein [Phycisphaeraceae bacterium]
MTQRTPRTKRASGFTIVELLVIISVILILIGIGVALMRSAMERGTHSETRATLAKLETAERVYRDSVLEGRPLPTNTNIRQLIERLKQHPEARQVLESIGDGLHPSRTDFTTVRDAWDREFRYFPQGSADLNRTESFFVSDGPDRRSNTNDDIYSFER